MTKMNDLQAINKGAYLRLKGYFRGNKSPPHAFPTPGVAITASGPRARHSRLWSGYRPRRPATRPPAALPGDSRGLPGARPLSPPTRGRGRAPVTWAALRPPFCRAGEEDARGLAQVAVCLSRRRSRGGRESPGLLPAGAEVGPPPRVRLGGGSPAMAGLGCGQSGFQSAHPHLE